MPDYGRRDLVFVVDDEPTIAQTAALILCGGGLDARAFTDPLAALKAAQTEAPDLLFSDVIMPGLNGFELGNKIFEDCPQCKVLLFSGNPAAREDYAKTQTEKNWEILEKPLHPTNLLNAIRSKLDSRLDA
jgi:DNA-binding NtrC family response regulator